MTVPSFVYISPGLTAMMRQEMTRFLLHTYTREVRLVGTDTGTGNPATDPGVDDWNQPVYTFADPEPNVSCFYEIREVPIVTPQGLIVRNLPYLVLDVGDTLKKGDRVSNIRTLGTDEFPSMLLVAGPVLVEDVRPRDPNTGGPLFLDALLRQVQVVPSS